MALFNSNYKRGLATTADDISCLNCPEWRMKFTSVEPTLFAPQISLSASDVTSLERDPLSAKTPPVMVVETQRVYRRSVPPESILERTVRSSSTFDRDAPKFNEIVVVTTRRADDLASLSTSPKHSYVKKTSDSSFLSSVKRDMGEDSKLLRNLRSRVDQYRKDIITDEVSAFRNTVSSKADTSHYKSLYPASVPLFPRRKFSFTDDDVSYSLPPRTSRSFSSQYCHSHPAKYDSTAGLSSASATALARSRVSFPSSSEFHMCPATRRMELSHHPHRSYRRNDDLETARRTRSEQRSVDNYLETAGLSLERLRADLRNTANKFSKHRQLIDRYLRLDPKQRLENVEPAVIKKYDEVAERIPELLIMNYGLYRRPLDAASLWSPSVDLPPKYVSTSSKPTRMRTSTPFAARGRIRSVISRTAHSVPRF